MKPKDARNFQIINEDQLVIEAFERDCEKSY
jgi:hypothetical protein